MSRDSGFRLEAFLDGVTGAGLFGWLHRPGAPVEFIATTDEVPSVPDSAVSAPRKPGSAPALQDFFSGSIFHPMTQAAAAGREPYEHKQPGPADQPAARAATTSSRK
jgi:hypothetical protein